MGGEHWQASGWAGAAADGLLVKFIETHAVLRPGPWRPNSGIAQRVCLDRVEFCSIRYIRRTNAGGRREREREREGWGGEGEVC